MRRTKSRFGARLEPFTHVDLLLYPGRSLDVITQAEAIRPYGAPLAADYPRYTAGGHAGDRRAVHPDGEGASLRQFLLLVGGLRALGEASMTRGWCWTPTCCGRSRWRGTRRRWRSAPACGTRAARDRAAAFASRRRRGVRVLPAARSGAPRRRRPCLMRRAAARRLGAPTQRARHQVECSGLVAAYLQWHLEHSIRSLRHVERV